MAQEQGCCGVRNCAELWGCKWTRQESQRTSGVSTGNQLVKLVLHRLLSKLMCISSWYFGVCSQKHVWLTFLSNHHWFIKLSGLPMHETKHGFMLQMRWMKASELLSPKHSISPLHRCSQKAISPQGLLCAWMNCWELEGIPGIRGFELLWFPGWRSSEMWDSTLRNCPVVQVVCNGSTVLFSVKQGCHLTRKLHVYLCKNAQRYTEFF